MKTKVTNLTDKLDHAIISLTKWRSPKKLTYSKFFSNKMLMIEVIREGVPYSLFNLIQLHSPFSENDWANFLDISTKSLQRYKQTSKQFKTNFI